MITPPYWRLTNRVSDSFLYKFVGRWRVKIQGFGFNLSSWYDISTAPYDLNHQNIVFRKRLHFKVIIKKVV